MSWRGFAPIKYFSLAVLLLVGLAFTGNSALAQGLGPIKFSIGIEPMAPLGDTVTLPLIYDSDSTGFEIGAIYLVVRYDTTALTLTQIAEGPMVSECDWEALQFGTETPGIINILTFAKFGSGQSSSCYFEHADDDTLALLTFAVTEDEEYDCTGHLVEFYWAKCSDNTLSSVTGDTVFYSDLVTKWQYDLYSGGDSLPTDEGAPDSCVQLRLVDFESGNIDILCEDYIDSRGDLNLNDIANEIADWVLFGNYFFQGLQVFQTDPPQQIEASDVNADGEFLTVRDAGYLWRIIIGDALPYPKAGNLLETDTALFIQDQDGKAVSLEFADSLVQIFMIFTGEIEPISELDPHVSIDYLPLAGQTRIMLFVWPSPYPSGHGGIFSGPLFTYTGEGELVTVEVADWHDDIVPTRIEIGGGATGCGDADGSSVVNITDVIYLVQYIFAGGAAPNPLTYGDANCDSIVNVGDAVYLLNFIFNAGTSPCNSCP
ncbi:MAG: cohesin domain-containing protein [bacterium]